MTWQVLRQLCNRPEESRKLTLLRESIQKGKESSLVKHHVMPFNNTEISIAVSGLEAVMTL